MALKRRTVLMWGGLLAVFGIGTYEAAPRYKPLETDPDGAKFVYRDGIITRIGS